LPDLICNCLKLQDIRIEKANSDLKASSVFAGKIDCINITEMHFEIGIGSHSVQHLEINQGCFKDGIKYQSMDWKPEQSPNLLFCSKGCQVLGKTLQL